MILHEKENLQYFAEAIRLTAAEFNVPQSYVEKDYYLTLALKHLSEYEYSDHVIFKGGTSLSKVYNAIHRFSEDIDLAILPGEDWAGARVTRVMKKAIDVAAQGLIPSETAFTSGSRFRKKRYYFPRVNANEQLGEVEDTLLIECNAFTTPSPVEKREIWTLIAEWATANNQLEFIDNFSLHKFKVSVLCWTRTFCEKILGLMAAAERGVLNEKVRHFYDLTVLLRHDEIKEFISSDEKFFHIMGVSVQNDIDHANSKLIPWIKEDISNNEPFENIEQVWRTVQKSYHGDFQMMITNDELTPADDEIISALRTISMQLKKYSDSDIHQRCLASLKKMSIPINLENSVDFKGSVPRQQGDAV